MCLISHSFNFFILNYRSFVDIDKNKAKTSSAKVSADFTDEVVKNKIVDFKGIPEFSENGETLQLEVILKDIKW